MNKRLLCILPYLFLIFSGLFIPSDGNHGALNPKSLAFLGAVSCAGIYFLANWRISLNQIKLLAFVCFSIAFLSLWFLRGSIFDAQLSKNAFDQGKLFFITILFVILTLYIASEKLISPQAILKAVVYINCAYSFCKVALVALHLLHVINMWVVIQQLGMRFMAMTIYGGIARLQTSVDIITPFLTLFVFQSGALGLSLRPAFKRFYLIVSILAIFLSFSRFLILVFLFNCFLHWVTASLYEKVKKGILFFAIVALGLSVFGLDRAGSVIEQRFFSKNARHSDQTRVDQINALLAEFESAPYLGVGLGGHAKNFIRDHALRHSYEVQWVAFLMQFGLIGLILLLLPLLFICAQFVKKFPLSLERCAFLSLFCVWLFSGFTNPFLISLTSGIVYAIFLLAAKILNREEEFAIGSA